MINIEILLLEDELQLGRIVAETLRREGFNVSHFVNGQAGLDAFYSNKYNLCIVDIMMPFVTGIDFVKNIRKLDAEIPVLFLTALTQDKDIIEGYQSGGNDYLKKPFSLEELLYRVKELIKRTRPDIDEESHQTVIGSFKFNPRRQELIGADNLVKKLSYKEAQLLHHLSSNKNKLLERKSVLINLWGDDSSFNARTMDVFISKLRKHLSADKTIEIMNLRGLGYKLICE